MFRPESDWTGQGRFGVKDFCIEAMATVQDATVDVRHFNWVLPSRGIFSPQKHYLDYSLDSQPRRSLIRLGAHNRCMPAGDILYMPPHREYIGEPALQERHLVCVALGDQFLDTLFDGERPLLGLDPCVNLQNAAMRRLFEADPEAMAEQGEVVTHGLGGVEKRLVRHQYGASEVVGQRDASECA